jgi:hypothetical protein
MGQKKQSQNIKMAKSDVSTMVSSILSAFGTGMDLFRRLQGKKELKRLRRDRKTKVDQRSRDSLQHRNKQKQKSRDRNHGDESEDGEETEDLRLRKSLEQAPEDIRREYETSVRRLGERFRKGDGILILVLFILLYAYPSSFLLKLAIATMNTLLQTNPRF